MAEYTTGHCPNHNQPGGCQLHNLQCGWPNCDRRQVQPQPPAGASVSERLLGLADEIDRQARECPTVDWRPNAHENARNLRAIEKALTQQRGEAAAHASGVPGRVTDALVSTVEAAMHACYMDHDDYRLTTTLLHDMAVAAVNVVATTPQPSADAVREDSNG